MNRYTVIQPPEVDAQLARLWLTASDRAAVTAASRQIDRELRENAEQKGEQVQFNLRKLVIKPLCVYYTVHPDDCLAKIWAIRLAKD